MAVAKYFVKRGEKQFGPLNGKQLKALASSKKLVTNDLIIDAGNPKKRQLARNIKGLLPATDVPENDDEQGSQEQTSDTFYEDFVCDAAEKRAGHIQDTKPDKVDRQRSQGNKCPKCAAVTRPIRINGKETGELFRPQCSKDGICPMCDGELCTSAAQQCLQCGRSWHALENDPPRRNTSDKSVATATYETIASERMWLAILLSPLLLIGGAIRGAAGTIPIWIAMSIAQEVFGWDGFMDKAGVWPMLVTVPAGICYEFMRFIVTGKIVSYRQERIDDARKY